MSMIRPGEYYGMPVPVGNELNAVHGLIEGKHGETDIGTVYDFACDVRPKIPRAVKHDMNVFREHEVDDFMSTAEIQEYCEGIQLGYEFVVGSFTYVRYLRSNHESLESYLDSLPATSNDLPLATRSQLKRVNRFRLGMDDPDPAIDWYANYERIQNGLDSGTILDSSLVAEADAGRYFAHASELGQLTYIAQEKAEMHIPAEYYGAYLDHSDVHDIAVARGEGFEHGVMHAIELYVQSYEQAVLEGHEDNLMVPEIRQAYEDLLHYERRQKILELINQSVRLPMLVILDKVAGFSRRRRAIDETDE
jgi:hypothetical protein